MKKNVVVFILSIFLPHVVLFAQSAYTEMGFNSLNNISYKNSEGFGFTSHSLSPQFRYEIGLRSYLSKKVVAYLGLSTDKYSFNLGNVNQTRPIESVYELDYFGANLGVDYLLLKKKRWDLFACGKFSRNVLSRGFRTDKEINTDSSYSLTRINNLVQDSDFGQFRYDVKFGLALAYRLSELTSFYTRYHYSQSLKIVENDQESYSFSSHVFSLGLTFNVQDYMKNKSYVSNLGITNDDENADYFIDQTDSDTLLNTVDKFHVKDSMLLKVYYPPNSKYFYDSHTKALDKIAELLLKDTSAKYNIIGYYDGLSDKNNGIERVRSVLDFFTEKGCRSRTIC